MTASEPLYLDYAASTPLDPDVLAAMMPFLNAPGNPHARHHSFGAKAARAVDTAKGQIAAKIGASAAQIIFTSGATEANNLALKGVAARLKAAGKTHIITGAVEHKSVLEPLRALERDGFRLTIVPPRPCGMIEAVMIEKAVSADTGLVSIQAVNNELGTIQPLAEIAAMLKGRDILFHSDAAQALGKIPLDVKTQGVDLLSLSAHKAYGPQGIGALYAAPGLLQPILQGGGQQNGLRSGTLPVALCVGFGQACAQIAEQRAEMQQMRDAFLEILAPLEPVIYGHSDPEWNVPGILNIRFPGIDSETLVMGLPGLAFGTGSACSSGREETRSHVIEAITGSPQPAREAIRISWGSLTSVTKLQYAAEEIVAAVTDIRKMQEAG